MGIKKKLSMGVMTAVLGIALIGGGTFAAGTLDLKAEPTGIINVENMAPGDSMFHGTDIPVTMSLGIALAPGGPTLPYISDGEYFEYGITQEVEPDEIVIEDYNTQPVFSYENSIREVVQVESLQSSHDGEENDIITADIIRPASSDKDLQVPTIVIPSPYFDGPGRGREGELKPDANATPHIVIGEKNYSADLLTESKPVTGQNGLFVDCGLAESPNDCPSNTEESIALIEANNNIDDQVFNVSNAGAIGAVIYDNEEGSFNDPLESDAPIPALGITQSDGLDLREKIDEGDFDTTLRELVDPINFFPLYYDNYFVPRGYAVALVDLPGSRASTGCIDVGGPAEVEGTAAVIEWLAGEGNAVDGTSGMEVTADWSNGKSALVGKSWDGTIPYGVAEQAPEGLEAIVPLVALSHWHSDFWTNGARYGGSTTLWHDSHNDNPSMENYCTETREYLAENEENPDPNTDFWQERNFLNNVDKFEASVFIVHGKNDYNVPPANYGHMWDALEEHDVPRKMWLSQVAHEKPFDFRRDEWMNTIHHWFDYWLHDIDNGVIDEPKVDVEHDPNEWTTYNNWSNGSSSTHLWLGNAEAEDDPRQGTLWTDPRYVSEDSVTFKEIRQNINTFAKDPYSEHDDRQVFLSPELSEPVHISGGTTVSVEANLEGENATLSAFLVDYGNDERINHAVGGGLETLETETCLGEGTEEDTGCYFDVGLRTHTSDFEVVTRGYVNTEFHLNEQGHTEENYQIDWDMHPHDYVFKKGHRIGIVITGPDTHLHNDNHPTTNNDIDIQLGSSSVQLPVVGGYEALEKAFSTDLSISANNIFQSVELFEEQGLFENDNAPYSLRLHLTAVSHYESQNAAEKVVQHMGGFMDLLNHQLDNDLIDEDVFNLLSYQTDELIEKWE
ncbi:TasA family protein [Virgibacillus oceani]